MKAILDSGELGVIKSVATELSIPRGIFPEDSDIRFNFDLGGGVLMDCGCRSQP